MKKTIEFDKSYIDKELIETNKLRRNIPVNLLYTKQGILKTPELYIEEYVIPFCWDKLEVENHFQIKKENRQSQITYNKFEFKYIVEFTFELK